MQGLLPEEVAKRVISTLDIPLFEDIEKPTAVRILRYFEKKQFGMGESVVNFGDPGDEMFIVVSGEAAVKVGKAIVHTFSAGSVIGEVCLVNTKSKRTATIVSASSKLILLSIDRFGYDEIRRNIPVLIEQVTRNIAKMLGEKLLMANERITLEQKEKAALRESEMETTRELTEIKEGGVFHRSAAALNWGKA